MASKLEVEVVTPEGTALSCEASAVQAPGQEGYLGVLPGHAPMLCLLRPGVLTVNEADNTKRVFAVRGGFLEVGAQRVTVLADQALEAGAIDPAEVEREIGAIEPLPERFEGETVLARSVAREQARAERELRIEWCEAKLQAHKRFVRG